MGSMGEIGSMSLVQFQEDLLARLQSKSTVEAISAQLAVKCGTTCFWIDMNDVSEILSVPNITRTPKTKGWFLGVASIRGYMYGVVDYGAYLAQVTSKLTSELTSKSKLILLHKKFNVGAGIVVDEVLGLKDEKSEWNNEQIKWEQIDIGGLIVSEEFFHIKAAMKEESHNV